jgi:hypothetical protein
MALMITPRCGCRVEAVGFDLREPNWLEVADQDPFRLAGQAEKSV